MKKILFSLGAAGAVFCNAQTGKVGIGTASPTSTLHIKGSLRLEHPSMGEGKLLRVYKDGNVKWDRAVPLPVLGAFDDPAGYSDDPSPTPRYYHAYITLPPGKWLVKLSLLMTPTDQAKNPNESILVSTYLSDSKTSNIATADYIAGSSTRISGVLNTPSSYGMVYGSVLINNTGNVAKTYYLWGSGERKSVGTANVKWQDFTANTWGENRIFAITIQ